MSVYSADQRAFFSIHLSNGLILHNVPVDITAAFLNWGGGQLLLNKEDVVKMELYIFASSCGVVAVLLRGYCHQWCGCLQPSSLALLQSYSTSGVPDGCCFSRALLNPRPLH